MGIYSISYRAYHLSYPENYQDSINAFTVTISHLCQDPVSITATAQNLVDPYLFTGDSPKIQFKLDPFKSDPPACLVTYSCTVISGPRSDLCSITDGKTDGTFDPQTGNY